jgi:hypothetical protein
MRTEFNEIISELKEALSLKTNQLIDCKRFDHYIQEQLNSLVKRIHGLEASGLEIENNYPDNPQMKINFKIRANEIKKEIQDLS